MFYRKQCLRYVTNASLQQTAATKQDQQTGLHLQREKISNSPFLAVEDKKEQLFILLRVI